MLDNVTPLWYYIYSGSNVIKEHVPFFENMGQALLPPTIP